MSDALHVVAAVILDQGKVLACRRRPEKSAGGLWEFPGGKVEAGESADEAVRREIAEELSVEIQVLGELTTDDTAVGDRTIRLTCMRAQLAGDRPTASSDHDRLEWLTAAELLDAEWAAPDLPAVRMLASEGL